MKSLERLQDPFNKGIIQSTLPEAMVTTPQISLLGGEF